MKKSARIIRCEQQQAEVLAAIRRLGRPTSSELAAMFGVPHKVMTKRLYHMRLANMVVRLGVAKCDARWADAQEPGAKEQENKDRTAPGGESARRIDPLSGTFTHRVVPASKRMLPPGLGVRSVFELGQYAPGETWAAGVYGGGV